MDEGLRGMYTSADSSSPVKPATSVAAEAGLIKVELYVQRHAFSCANLIREVYGGGITGIVKVNLYRGWYAPDAQLCDVGMEQAFQSRESYFSHLPDDFFDFAGSSMQRRAMETALLALPVRIVKEGNIYPVRNFSEQRDMGGMRDYDNQPLDVFHHRLNFCESDESQSVQCSVKEERVQWHRPDCKEDAPFTDKEEHLHINYSYYDNTGQTGSTPTTPNLDDWIEDLEKEYIPNVALRLRRTSGGDPVRLYFSSHSHSIQALVQKWGGDPKKPANASVTKFTLDYNEETQNLSVEGIESVYDEDKKKFDGVETENKIFFVAEKAKIVRQLPYPCGARRCDMMGAPKTIKKNPNPPQSEFWDGREVHVLGGDTAKVEDWLMKK
eukprot:g4162.t1